MINGVHQIIKEICKWSYRKRETGKSNVLIDWFNNFILLFPPNRPPPSILLSKAILREEKKRENNVNKIVSRLKSESQNWRIIYLSQVIKYHLAQDFLKLLENIWNKTVREINTLNYLSNLPKHQWCHQVDRILLPMRL